MISFCPENLCDTIQVSGSIYIFGSIYIVDFGRWKTLKKQRFFTFSIPLKNHPQKFSLPSGFFLPENKVVQIVSFCLAPHGRKMLFFAQKYNSLFTVSEPTTFSSRFQIVKNAAKTTCEITSMFWTTNVNDIYSGMFRCHDKQFIITQWTQLNMKMYNAKVSLG